jgi:hypothetical protein
MRKIAYFCLAGCFVLLLLTVQARAADEQWLQYHSARQVSLTGFSSNQKSLSLTTEKPAGVELPKFKSSSPLFTKWSSPMVKGGFLWVALDTTAKNGIYDSLYIDSNGNGRLDDETPVAAYRTSQPSTYFGPVKVGFQVEDGPVTYHLNFQYNGPSQASRRLLVSSAGWYEGNITVNGKPKNCVLFDYNSNGTFNDKSVDSAEADRIRIGQAGTQNTRFVGKYIEVDGKLYEPEISRDGAYIKLHEAKDVKYGNINLPANVVQLTAGGENGQFIVKIANKVGTLPVGQYRITEWTLERKDDKGVTWKIMGTPAGVTSPVSKLIFEVAEAKETSISIGEPVLSDLTSTLRAGTYNFSQSLKGQGGESITLSRSGARPPAPKLRIKNADGSYDKTFSFSYG